MFRQGTIVPFFVTVCFISSCDAVECLVTIFRATLCVSSKCFTSPYNLLKNIELYGMDLVGSIIVSNIQLNLNNEMIIRILAAETSSKNKD